MPFYLQGVNLSFEGDFSSYSEKWNITVTGAVLSGFSVQGSNVFLNDYNGLDVYVRALSDGSAVDSDSYTTALTMGGNFPQSQSLTAKYVVRRIAATQFEIWKDGSVLQTVTIATANIQGLFISHDGKYIAIGTNTLNRIYLYEGS